MRVAIFNWYVDEFWTDAKGKLRTFKDRPAADAYIRKQAAKSEGGFDRDEAYVVPWLGEKA